MEKDFTIKCYHNEHKISVSEYDDGIWISLVMAGAHVYTTISKEQALKLAKALTELAEEVAA